MARRNAGLVPEGLRTYYILEVSIGGSLEAISQLEKKLGIDLTTGFELSEWTPSKL